MKSGTLHRCCCVLAALGGLLCARMAVAQGTPIGVSPEFSVGSWVVGPQARAGSSPAVAFDGHQYLVVWVSQTEAHAVLGVRVRPDGTVLDVPAILVAYDAEDAFQPTTPAVAFDGQRFVVAWNTSRGVKATHVEADGTVPFPQGVEVYSSWSHPPDASPAIGCADGECLIAWGEKGDDWGWPLGARRLRSDLSSPDSYPISVSRFGTAPSISAAHGGYLIAWEQIFEMDPPKIRARTLPRQGPVPYDAGFYLGGVSGLGGQYDPHVSAFDEGWFVVWRYLDYDEGQYIHGTRVGPTGTVLDANGTRFTHHDDGSYGPPRAAFDGKRWLLTWTEKLPGSEPRLSAVWVATDLSTSALPGVLVPAPRYPLLYEPDVAAGVDGFLLTYLGLQSAPLSQGFAIFGTRVGADGVALDRPDLVLSSTVGTQERPAVARGGSEELLVWAETRTLAGSTVLGARLGGDGKRVGPEVVLPSAPGARRPAVSWDGSRYLVVWEEPAPDGGTDIRGARVSATGKLLDAASLAISTAPGDQRSPAVTFAAGRWWVVWEDTRNAVHEDRSDIYGTRVRYFGEVVDPDGLRLSLAPGTQQAPAVTFLGDDLLVVWESHAPWPWSPGDIRGTRVRWNGEVRDPAGLAISATTDEQRAPAVASDGTRALVVWEDHRLSGGRALPKILGARVDATGAVLEPKGLGIATTTARLCSAATVSFDGLHFWVAWESRPSSDSFTAPHRVDVRGARVTLGGQVELSEVGLSVRPDAELGPVLSSDGQGHSRIYYRRFVQQPAAGTERIKGRFIQELSSTP